jgi:hypothetical protein
MIAKDDERNPSEYSLPACVLKQYKAVTSTAASKIYKIIII